MNLGVLLLGVCEFNGCTMLVEGGTVALAGVWILCATGSGVLIMHPACMALMATTGAGRGTSRGGAGTVCCCAAGPQCCIIT